MKRLLLLLLLSMAAHASAADGIFYENGEGKNVDMWRVGMVWQWDKRWHYGENWQITGSWELAAGMLRGDKPNDNDQIINDVSITPMFRLSHPAGSGLSPYLEGGILGIHLISRAFAYNGRKLGSGFQFGHQIGFGVEFGSRRQYSLGYRAQHMSNGGLVHPNQGLDFNEVHFTYYF